MNAVAARIPAADLPYGCAPVLVLRPSRGLVRQWNVREVEAAAVSGMAHWTPGSSAKLLEAALAALGLPGPGRDGVRIAGVNGGSAEFAFPRVAWTELPILGGPRFKLQLPGAVFDAMLADGRADLAEGHDPRPSGVALPVSLEHTPLVILDCPADGLPDLAGSAWRMFAAAGRPASAPVAWFDGERLMDAAATVADAVTRERPSERFLWTYRLNMLALAPRMARRVVDEHPANNLAWTGDATAARTMAGTLSDPWSIQVLFALRRTDPQPLPVTTDNLLTTPGVPGYRADADAPSIAWTGTGARPPLTWRLNRGQPANDISPPPAWAMHQLCMRGLATVDDTGRGRITPRGDALLRLMPVELDDPDMLLRWRTPDGALCGDRNVPAADRWLTRAFRALKRRVPMPVGHEASAIEAGFAE